MSSLRSAFLLVTVLGLAAYAQAQPPAKEDLLVTNQMRMESVLDVPVAISVFTDRAIEDLSVRNLSDLGRFAAGVEMNNQKSLQPIYSIRGVETSDWTVGSDPAIAIYIDGFYAARGAGAETALVDLSRVQILRGPQGTLHGRNALGGVVDMRTNRPGLNQDGRLKLTLGNYDRIDGELIYNQPISDDFSFRLVASSRQRSPYLDNQSGRDLNDEDQKLFRLSLLWLGGDHTEILWRAEYSELEQTSAAQHTLITSVYERAQRESRYHAFGDVALDFTNRESREAISSTLEINHFMNALTFTSITGWREFDTRLDEDLDGSDNPDYAFASRNPEDNRYVSQEFRLSASNESLRWTAGMVLSREEVERNTSALLNASTLESFAWASILRSAGSTRADQFLGTVAGLDQAEIDDLTTYESSRIAEVVPDFREQQKAAGLDGIAASSLLWSWLQDQGALTDYGLSEDPAIGVFSQILPDLQPRISALDPWIEAVQSEGTYDSYALYADATWRVTQRLNLTGGLRYTYDDKEFSVFTEYQNTLAGADFGLAFYNTGQARVDVNRTDSWDYLSGRIVLDYSLGDDTMLYSSIANGFNSGRYNSLNFNPDIDDTTDEEEIISYEVGLKGQYLNNNLQLGVAAFFYEHDNLQELQLMGRPIPSYNLRTSNAEGYGAEVEALWLVSPRLNLSGNYSYLETEYTRYALIDAVGESAADDLSGEPRTGTPRHKINLSLQYAWQLAGFGLVIPRLDYTWVDRRQDSRSDPYRTVDAFSVTNARVTWLSGTGNWELALWSTNLFDEEVHTRFGDDGDAIGSLTGMRTPPRMYGADFVFHF